MPSRRVSSRGREPGTAGDGARDVSGRSAGSGPGVREVLAERFLLEYHRLGGAAAAATHDGMHAQDLRRRAATWRTTAGRIRAASEGRWPHWLLRHLQAYEGLSEIGPEYARQRALVCIYLAPQDRVGGGPESGGSESETSMGGAEQPVAPV